MHATSSAQQPRQQQRTADAPGQRRSPPPMPRLHSARPVQLLSPRPAGKQSGVQQKKSTTKKRRSQPLPLTAAQLSLLRWTRSQYEDSFAEWSQLSGSKLLLAAQPLGPLQESDLLPIVDIGSQARVDAVIAALRAGPGLCKVLAEIIQDAHDRARSQSNAGLDGAGADGSQPSLLYTATQQAHSSRVPMFSIMQRSMAAMRRPVMRHAAAQAEMHCGRANAAAAAAASATPPAAAASASAAAPSARRPGVGVTMTILRESALPPSAVAAASPLTTSTTLPTKEWQVLLVRRSKAPLAGWWALPGGSIEYGETIQRAAVRETKEETNLKVAVRLTPEPFHVTQYIEHEPQHAPAAAAVPAGPPHTVAHFILLHMLADPLEGSAASSARAGDDAAELRWFSTTRLSDMVRLQQIAANQSQQGESSDSPPAPAPSTDPIIPSVARVVREGVIKRREQIAAKAAAEQQALSSRVTNASGGHSAVQAARRLPADKTSAGGKPKRTGSSKPWEHPAKHPGATPWPRAQRDAMKQRKREKRADSADAE